MKSDCLESVGVVAFFNSQRLTVACQERQRTELTTLFWASNHTPTKNGFHQAGQGPGRSQQWLQPPGILTPIWSLSKLHDASLILGPLLFFKPHAITRLTHFESAGDTRRDPSQEHLLNWLNPNCFFGQWMRPRRDCWCSRATNGLDVWRLTHFEHMA